MTDAYILGGEEHMLRARLAVLLVRIKKQSEFIKSFDELSQYMDWQVERNRILDRLVMMGKLHD